jgi:hypothetical protein
MATPNYYEFLQISPNAEAETIQRVFRFLANRYHPDHPRTADPEKFLLLKTAYDVLSNPDSRAQYDAQFRVPTPEANQLSTSIDFMDSMDGELNRRLAVLGLLYFRRRTNPDKPAISLAELEDRMGFPREYLDFTIWYLQKKGYIIRADNSDFTLTVDGVDFVEDKRSSIPVLNRLLTSDASPSAHGPVHEPVIVPLHPGFDAQTPIEPEVDPEIEPQSVPKSEPAEPRQGNPAQDLGA